MMYNYYAFAAKASCGRILGYQTFKKITISFTLAFIPLFMFSVFHLSFFIHFDFYLFLFVAHFSRLHLMTCNLISIITEMLIFHSLPLVIGLFYRDFGACYYR